MHHHAQHIFIFDLSTFPLFLNSFLLKISIDQLFWSGLNCPSLPGWDSPDNLMWSKIPCWELVSDRLRVPIKALFSGQFKQTERFRRSGLGMKWREGRKQRSGPQAGLRR
jgi:hypothetical protein